MKLSEIAPIARADILTAIDAADRAAQMGDMLAVRIWRDRVLALRQAATALYTDLKAHD